MKIKGEQELREYLLSDLVEKVQTLSIVAGTMACNARCPDCVSLMTTKPELYDAFNFKGVEWDYFDLALRVGLKGGIRAVLFTGKGEPTLIPEQLDSYLTHINNGLENNPYAVPGTTYRLNRELQTNGLILQDPKFQKKGWLQRWHDNNLNLISLSVVDVLDEVNHAFYNPHQKAYPPLEKTVELIHSAGYPIRLSVTMTNGRVSAPDDIERMVEYVKKTGIEQLSVRPVRKPEGDTYCQKVARWVEENQLTPQQEKTIVDYVEANNDRVIERLMHGAVIYKFRDHNLCLTDCLTVNHKGDNGNRQLIFYSNGMLTDGWTDEAHTILDIGHKCREYLKQKRLLKIEEA